MFNACTPLSVFSRGGVAFPLPLSIFRRRRRYFERRDDSITDKECYSFLPPILRLAVVVFSSAPQPLANIIALPQLLQSTDIHSIGTFCQLTVQPSRTQTFSGMHQTSLRRYFWDNDGSIDGTGSRKIQSAS